jgi:hypothetical protein
MSKIPASAVNYGLLAKFSSVSFPRTGGCGVPLEMTEGNYFNVGHRGPVYKGLGAMNPCDPGTSSWRMIQARHMARMGRRMIHTWFWLGNPKEKDHVEDIDIDWMIIIKRLLEMEWEGVELIHLAQHAECCRLS